MGEGRKGHCRAGANRSALGEDSLGVTLVLVAIRLRLLEPAVRGPEARIGEAVLAVGAAVIRRDSIKW